MRNWLQDAIGRVLHAKRKELKLTIRDLAQLSSVSTQIIISIERGRTDVDLVVLNDLAAAMDLGIDKLFVEAYRLDHERVLIITAEAENVFAQWNETERELVFARTAQSASEFISNERLDVIAIDAEFFDQVESDIDAQNLPVRRVVRYVFDSATTLPSLDEILQTTAKGRICALRRLQKQLTARRIELRRTREEIAERRSQLQTQLDAFTAIAKSPVDDSSGAAALKRERAQLERKAADLASREADLIDHEKRNNERSRFLARREDWVQNEDTDPGTAEL